jgi:hypothetical protein
MAAKKGKKAKTRTPNAKFGRQKPIPFRDVVERLLHPDHSANAHPPDKRGPRRHRGSAGQPCCSWAGYCLAAMGCQKK